MTPRALLHLLSLLLGLAALPICPVPASAADELFEMTGFFPVTIGGNTVRLEGMLIKQAETPGKLPVAIFTNGGATPTSDVASKPADYAPIARDLARRGWLSVVVMRRGYGRSGGDKPAPMPCQSSAFRTWASAAADDLQATMAYLAQRADADMDRVMVIGPDSGGAAAVALSARNPRGLVAAVSIAGGVLSESGCSMSGVLGDAFREFGDGNKVSNLWIYARSSKSVTRDIAERMHSGFLTAGGDVKFVEFHSWGDTDKDILTNSRRQWLLQLDGFLRARKLPTWSVADAVSVADKMKLIRGARNNLISFLMEIYSTGGSESALAYSPTAPKDNAQRGIPGRSTMGSTLEGAKNAALEACRKSFGNDCFIAMENLRWVGP